MVIIFYIENLKIKTRIKWWTYWKIKTTIGSEIAKESGFSIKALKALREKNEMKILDTDLNKDFETLVNRQTQSASNSSSNK